MITTARKSGWRTSTAAFTLVEILVTFAVIGLLITITTTFLRLAGPTLTLRSATRDLASDLRYASELSLSTQIPHAVRLDANLQRYSIVRQTVPEVILKQVSLDSSLSFASVTIPEATAVFNSLGATSTPGTITIRHTNNATVIIDIRPSGYVRIE